MLSTPIPGLPIAGNVWVVAAHRPEEERVALPLDPEEALRALLKVKPEDPPVDDHDDPAE